MFQPHCTRRAGAFLFALLCILFATRSLAANQDLNALQALISPYVTAQLGGNDKTIKVEAADIDPRLQLPACAKPEAFTPPGARLWGQTSIGLRCNNPVWSIYVPTSIHIFGPAVYSAAPLARGKVLVASDLTVEQADLSDLGPGVLSRPEDALGKILTIGLPAHFPLRTSMLKMPLAVLSGQTIHIRGRTDGIEVSNQGRAMSNGAVGERIPVKLSSGRIIYATITGSGLAEVEF